MGLWEDWAALESASNNLVEKNFWSVALDVLCTPSQFMAFLPIQVLRLKVFLFVASHSWQLPELAGYVSSPCEMRALLLLVCSIATCATLPTTPFHPSQSCHTDALWPNSDQTLPRKVSWPPSAHRIRSWLLSRAR